MATVGPEARSIDPATAALIYVPGIVRSAKNGGARVADVLAHEASLRPGSYRAVESELQVPPGLRAGKTVVDPEGRRVLEVLELDYHRKLEEAELVDGTAAFPGFLRTAGTACLGFLRLGVAVTQRNRAKDAKVKFQLAVGFGFVGLLLLATAFTAASALLALGLGDRVPGQLLGDGNEAADRAIKAGAATAAVWVVVRNRVLLTSLLLRRILRVGSDIQHRQTLARILLRALDGLRDAGWTGPIHVAGFSFGAVIAFDALYPKADEVGPRPLADERRLASTVTSFVTIGCPVDLIRLYWPTYFPGRVPLVPESRWVNVFNAADIFGSNFLDGSDHSRDVAQGHAGAAADGVAGSPSDERDASRPEAGGGGIEDPSTDDGTHPIPDVVAAGVTPGQQVPYLTGGRALEGFFLSGMKVHSQYWGEVDDASCFRHLVDLWIPPSASAGAPAAPATEGVAVRPGVGPVPSPDR